LAKYLQRRGLRWRVGSAIVLLLAAIGAGVLIGRSSAPSGSPTGLASKSVVASIDAGFAAFNRGDIEAFAAGFPQDVVFEDAATGAVGKGRQQLVNINRDYYNQGARYYRDGPVIQYGDLVAYPVKCPPCPGAWSGIDLVKLDDNLEAVHVWTGYTAKTPTTR
jgi:hypothetical protein